MRNWLYRGLVIVAAGLIAWSFNIMWWALSIKQIAEGRNVVQIFPYALKEYVPKEFKAFLTGSQMPGYFEPLMWIYFGLVLAALLAALFLGRKSIKFLRFRANLSAFIVGFVGFSYAVVIGLFIIVAAIRTGDFWGTHLLGETWVNVGGAYQTWVVASFQLGFYVAVAAAALCLALGIFRNKIIGKSAASQ